MIARRAQPRTSLIAQLDRIFSMVLALAFLVSGFQAGYRLTHGSDHFANVNEGLQGGGEHLSGVQVPTATPVPIAESLPIWRGTDRINLLLMGIDQRPGAALPGLADVIMIASVDPVQGGVVLVSIPRDLWVEIPGHGERRINSAYFYGELDGSGGARLMKSTIEHTFGFSVDYYGRLDFQCFKQIIDILGGITVDVPEPVRDDRYPDDHYGYMSVYIPAGRQHMDGETALQYVRARHESSDFSRMRRQQQVLLAARDKALRLDIIFSLPELIPLFGRTFSTDVALDDLLALANLATQIDLEDIQLRVIDETLTIPYVTADGARVLLPRLDRIREMLDEALHDVSAPSESPGPEVRDPRVLVRADSTRPGLAEEVADFLRRRGYDAWAKSDGVQIESEGTFVASRSDMAETAILISALLRAGSDLAILGPDVEDGLDIVVTLGRTYVMPR